MHRAGHVGDLDIAAVPFDGHSASDVLQCQRGIVIIHAGLHIAGDAVDVHVAAVGGEGQRGMELAHVHVAVIAVAAGTVTVRSACPPRTVATVSTRSLPSLEKVGCNAPSMFWTSLSFHA